ARPLLGGDRLGGKPLAGARGAARSPAAVSPFWHVNAQTEGHDRTGRSREAFRASGRSALVIGGAAVEVATKECVSALAPDADWLVLELQTPPVPRMLREY